MSLHRHYKETKVKNKGVSTLEDRLRRAGLSVQRDEPMSAHTTFRIGGPADLFVVAENREQLLVAVEQAREDGVTPFLLGEGANLLVSDAGIRGVVIAYRAAKCAFLEKVGEVLLTAEAGAALRDLSRESVSRGLQGLEWAVDVPGTVGGAVIGNAGAFGGYISDCLRTVNVLEPDGTIHEMQKVDIQFGYRNSRFRQQAREERTIILDATMVLRPGNANEIATRAAEYTRRRRERQPKDCSCGSVFKRTENFPPGFLIEQCGLKGERRGNAMISPNHANFIINLGGARAADVRALIELMRECVKAQFGEELELEVELVGQW